MRINIIEVNMSYWNVQRIIIIATSKVKDEYGNVQIFWTNQWRSTGRYFVKDKQIRITLNNNAHLIS